MNIKKISLNLLMAFDALMAECSVSVAARKCHVTQAAMSNTLKQLREVFSDPLFIRESKGIKPTPRAMALHRKVREALTSIERVFVEEDFAPASSSREFHLALSEHGENLILPGLYKYMSIHAPNIKLRVTPYTMSVLDIDRLSTEIDVAIGANYGASQQIISEMLMCENGICVMSKHHDYAQKTLTLKSYLSLKHIAVNYNPHSSLSYIDDTLKQDKLFRNVIMYITNIRTALELLKQTDLIGTFPKILVMGLVNKKDFAFKKMPFAVPDYEISLLYHKRYSVDPAHAWLVGVIKMIAKNTSN